MYSIRNIHIHRSDTLTDICVVPHNPDQSSKHSQPQPGSCYNQQYHCSLQTLQLPGIGGRYPASRATTSSQDQRINNFSNFLFICIFLTSLHFLQQRMFVLKDCVVTVLCLYLNSLCITNRVYY